MIEKGNLLPDSGSGVGWTVNLTNLWGINGRTKGHEQDLPSDELMREQAYLVSRGVRSLAILGTIENSSENSAVAYERMADIATESAGSQAIVPIPFLVEKPGPNRISFGFASYTWVVNVYQWLSHDPVPPTMVSRILGLLLGYSAEAIAEYERFQTGRRVSQSNLNEERPPHPKAYSTTQQRSTQQTTCTCCTGASFSPVP